MRHILLHRDRCFSTGLHSGPELQRPSHSIRERFALRSRCRRTRPHSLADLKWFEVFKDEKLQELIRTRSGAELRSARRGRPRRSGARRPGHHALRAISQLRRGRQPWKSIVCRAMARRQYRRNFCPRRIATSGQRRSQLLSFEIDIWGRLRRATEAARANLLSAEENRKAVVTTLVSDVATAYLTLRELDYELEISSARCRRAKNRWN